MKPTQPHRGISIPKGYHIQNNYAATMSNRLQWNPSIPSSECAAEQTPRTAEPVEERIHQWRTRKRPSQETARGLRLTFGHIVGNRADFNLLVDPVSVNVGMKREI
jgi:hypothetical protein